MKTNLTFDEIDCLFDYLEKRCKDPSKCTSVSNLCINPFECCARLRRYGSDKLKFYLSCRPNSFEKTVNVAKFKKGESDDF